MNSVQLKAAISLNGLCGRAAATVYTLSFGTDLTVSMASAAVLLQPRQKRNLRRRHRVSMASAAVLLQHPVGTEIVVGFTSLNGLCGRAAATAV